MKEVEDEFKDIQKIRSDAKPGVGFKTVHVRKRIPDPLNGCKLTISDLKGVLRPAKIFKAVGFLRTRGAIPGSFAWTLDGDCMLWGTADNQGKITRFCLRGCPIEKTEPISEVFAKLTKDHGLCFVDWCAVTCIDTNIESFNSYFKHIIAKP